MKTLFTLTLILITLSSSSLLGQENFNALSWRQNTAFNAYLMREVHQQYAERTVELNNALKSKAAMIEYRDDLRKRYESMLGDFPKKEALNAQVLKISPENGFTIETIIFESLPKRYVTANLYLPEGKGPFAASLHLCGHGIKGKAGSLIAPLMAQNGIAVLVIDPIGQGERIQFLKDDGKSATRGATTEHTLLNAGCNLLGSNLAAYEWWDNHRAIDYLETRTDIDKNRLAAYGSSGGGTQTAYLIGLEKRLKVASICSYFSQRERVLELSGASDGCQHIPNEGSEHIEIADFVTMFAPKPVLIMSGLYDFVDYWGASQGFNELKKVYETLGEGEAIQQLTTESGHGMPKEKREALVTWFRRWLYNDPNPVIEKQPFRTDETKTQCTSSGQVLTEFSDAISIPEYNQILAKKWAKERSLFLLQNDSIVRQKVFSLLGMNLTTQEVTAEQTSFSKEKNYDLYKYQLVRKGELPLPCVVLIPETLSSSSKVVIWLNESGKDNILKDESILNHSVKQGEILVVADLRGYGETTDPENFNESKYWNSEYRNAMIGLHIRKTIVGQRVTDIFSLLDFISTNAQFADYPIQLKANGTYGPVAIHATYLDRRIAQTEISNSIKSYLEFIENPMQRNAYTNVVPSVLKYYDLKDLCGKAGKSRIKFMD